MALQIDKIYKVSHSRKGVFTLKIASDSDDWVDGEIIEGKTNTILPYNQEYKGDFIRIRKSLCKFKLLN